MYREAARVGVLDDRDGVLGKVGHCAPRGVSVEIVGVRHVDAVELLGTDDSTGGERRGVQGSLLMRVFAVSKVRDAAVSERQLRP